jgi:serine/threonine protein kinase/serine/threonine protein phosphatase PrpC
MSTGTPTRTTVGPYRITGFLGAGGMGVVWRATHRELQRDVAIKRLSGSACEGVPLERFRNEARLHSSLNHPNIVTLYDFFDDDGVPCIVMEYVAGPTIEERLLSGPFTVHEATTIVETLAEAVGYLHQRGILHRDIKPSNVKLRPGGSPVLLDFGIARAEGDPRLTRTGMIIGSPHTIAPEQFEGRAIDGRADVWSLGVLLYEMLTGHPPFVGTSVAALANAILSSTIEPASERVTSLPQRADVVISRALQRDPAKRFQNCEQLAEALRALRQSTPRAGQARASAQPLSIAWLRTPFATRAIVGLSAVALLSVAALVVVQQNPPPVPTVSGPTMPGTDSMSPVTRPHADSLPASPDEHLTTRISLAEGIADVYINNRRVGETPYVHAATVGTSVTVTLRRVGFRDETVTFVVSHNQREYTLLMQRDASALPAPAAFGFLTWLRRRRRNQPSDPSTASLASRAAVTGERTIAERLSFHAAVRSDVGCIRDGNEDVVRAVPVPDGSLVAILCDGMGGHAAGEVAADLAVRTLEQRAAALTTSQALSDAVDAANQQIRIAMTRDSALRGMGTTCVVMRLCGHTALCAHVGDSRAYLVRGGAIYRLTEDHSHVRSLVRDGSIADQDARHHPDKNVILRALGPAERVSATTWSAPLQLRAGDRFLLSSDGLHDLADDDEFLPALALDEAAAACDALIELARGRGAPDNVSVCVVDVSAQGGAAPHKAAASPVSV